MTSQPHPQPLQLRTGPSRSGGVHLSGVLKYVARVLNIAKYQDDDLDLTIATALGPGPHKGTSVRFALGFAWEQWLAAQIPGLIWQPGEICLDQVFMTMDGIDCDLRVHEFKTTYKSSKNPITVHQMWMWQGCGYIKGLQAQYGASSVPLEVIYHPVYLRGDYQGIDPEYRPTCVSFEQGEVDSVWDMVVRNRDKAKQEGATSNV